MERHEIDYWLTHLHTFRNSDGQLSPEQMDTLKTLVMTWVPAIEADQEKWAGRTDLSTILMILLHALDSLSPQVEPKFLVRMYDSKIWSLDSEASFKSWLFALMIPERSDTTFEQIMQAVQNESIGSQLPFPVDPAKVDPWFWKMVAHWLDATIDTAYTEPARFPISRDTLLRYQSAAHVRKAQGRRFLKDK